MSVYQVIKNEYYDDDGHYDADPVDDIVYRDEADAVKVRDVLNLAAVNEQNANHDGPCDCKVDPKRGRQTSRWCPVHGEVIFRGDPTDVEAVEKFAYKYQVNYMTYFTIDTLRLL